MIRKFCDKDCEKLIALLRLNTPEFFDPSEEKDLIEYLDFYADNYFVMEVAGKVIGGGGINFGFENGTEARISWDLIHPDYHGKGLGTKLTSFRIAEICTHDGVEKIEVRTSQHVYQFYEKQGFTLIQVIKDFWAPGYDLYKMCLDVITIKT